MKNLITIVLISCLSVYSFANDGDDPNKSTESIQSETENIHDISLGHGDDRDLYGLEPETEEDLLRQATQTVVNRQHVGPQYAQDATQYILWLWRNQDERFAPRAQAVFDRIIAATTDNEIGTFFRLMIQLIRIILNEQLEAVITHELQQLATAGFQLNQNIIQRIRDEFRINLLAGRIRYNQADLQTQFQNYHRNAFIIEIILPIVRHGIEYLRRAGLPVTDAEQEYIRTRYTQDYLAGQVTTALGRDLEIAFTRYYGEQQPVRSPVMWNASLEDELERDPSPVEVMNLPSPRGASSR